VRDREARGRKADKIVRALKTHAADLLTDGVCLDIGCSAGVISAAVAPLCQRAIGLDFDEIAFDAIAPEARGGVQFLRGDAMALPVADASVDVVICAQVYEHVPDDRTLLTEMDRVLKPGGVIFFSGPNWLFPIEPHYFLPFLHWLPPPVADLYLRLARQGDRYYERSRHLWGLRELTAAFEVRDLTREVLEAVLRERQRDWLAATVRGMPEAFWQTILPLMPNYNWILRKPVET
jgi:SAM-dependent methyltransferase